MTVLQSLILKVCDGYQMMCHRISREISVATVILRLDLKKILDARLNLQFNFFYLTVLYEYIYRNSRE